ncbi:lamin tail domain-containing protein [Luteolibacter sp. Populi]|uniref:lamin tail domain-containing protein n=1 Tax=Luteolibacter sp. Populi TaxID=3230487 RepID=UPI003465159C
MILRPLFHPFFVVALLAFPRLWADTPDAVVTINEIHYNPLLTQDAEWVELHNQMAVNVDISGWSLGDGVTFKIPAGIVIPGGGYRIIAKTPGHASLAGIPGVLGPFAGNLSNSGETIDLLNSSGRLMDRLEYSDSGDWPVAADGAGATLAKRKPGLAAANPANWRASLAPGGSPATVNFPSLDQPISHALADQNSTWRFYDAVSAPPANWNSAAFADAGWQQGLPSFGSPSTTPSLIVTATLNERFRAGALTGLVDGAAFTTWPDTATGDGASQDATEAGDPRYETNATPTGQPAVSFDGTDEFRTTASPGIGPTSGFVYFVVCKASVPPDNGGVADGNGDYIFDRDISVSDPPLFSLKADGGRYGLQTRYDNNTGIGGPVSTTAISQTQFQIVAVRRNPALGRFEIWVDGTLEGTSPDNGSSLTPQPIVIGCHANNSNAGFKGEIAELLIYRNELSDSEFQSAGAYLEAQYGLDTAFPDSPVQTPISATASTSYYRRSFTFTGDPSRTVLKLNHTTADGAVFYLNGQELTRTNMPGGAPGHATSAVSDQVVPVSSGLQTVPSPALVAGTNVLGVSVHTGASDNTAYFSAELQGLESPVDPNASPALQLNEIAAASAPGFFIELRNPGAVPASTAGFSLEVIGSLAASFALPAASVPAGGVVQFTETQLGFRPAAGDKVILRSPGGSLADVQAADSVLRGASELWPGRWLFPSSPTPGAANAITLQQDIVINEICYHAPELSPASDDKQWLELYNRGASPVNLAGWSFGSGIEFEFAPGTVIAAGGYLVVAKDPSGLLTNFPGISIVGPYDSSLAGSGERILLLDAAGNPADDVSYIDGGRWPGAADGEGSTLELRDPRSDNSLPEAWAASNESARRSWQTYTYRVTAASSSVGPDGQWREFVLGMLDSGDVLLDDITVTERPGVAPVAMINGGDFQNGLPGWRFLGNHRHAGIVPDPDAPGNMVLYLSSKGPTEHMHNHVETTLAAGRSVTNGWEYEISFRARWLSGSNLINTRLYFNRAAKTTALSRTDDPGTPGGANSTALANAGPSFAHFSHSPVVPSPGEAVVVTTRAIDPDGLGAFTLRYSVDGAAPVAVAMAAGSDGTTFTGTIPGQSAAKVVRFWVSGNDAALTPATSTFPADGADSHALYQVNDSLAATNGRHNLRIIMAPADEALLYQLNNVMSNERLGCTVIYDERETYYDVGVRLKSSQRGRAQPNRVGYNIGFNRDQLFRGVHRTVSVDRSEGQSPGCQEILYDHMMYASGSVPAEYNDLCKVIAPNPAHSSSAILQMARYGDVFLDSQFANGGDGTSYEYELIYYPLTTDANGYKLPEPDNVVGTDIRDLGDNKENYRHNFLIENNEDKDDYSRIVAMGKQFQKSGAAFEAGLTDIIDIDQWLRALACSCASGAGDSFFANANHNGIFYAGIDGRVLYFPHDMDFSFSATRDIYENSELQKIIANPLRERIYLGHLHDICTRVFNQDYMQPWTTHYGSLLPGEDFGGHLNYITTRSNYILGQVNSKLAEVPFVISTNGGLTSPRARVR